MALASDYTEMRIDQERWAKVFVGDNKAMLAGLGWLIIDTLNKTKKPVVVIFDNLEVPHDEQRV